MRQLWCLAILGMLSNLGGAPAVQAQPRPYIGYTYPAGGQQGATFQIKLGGQNLDGVHEVLVTGAGVQIKVLESLRRLNPQETQLLNEELRELKRSAPSPAAAKTPANSSNLASAAAREPTWKPVEKEETPSNLVVRIEQRLRETVPVPASDSIASLLVAEVSIDSNAGPGEREIRLVTSKGVSNPLKFYVGQLPEFSRKPMITASKQVLGKEEQALRKRPPEEVEDRITLPCTVNGQIASGEVNRYRFEAHRGQRLVIRTQARQLIPFLADAVPGWFQPVLTLYDAKGKEVAYDDDYRFNPDPTILYQIPKDDQYVLAIYDSIYRGREDFVYRITISELPFITSIFPLGAPSGVPAKPKMTGWNLSGAVLGSPDRDAVPGIYPLVAHKKDLVSNRVHFALDTLPEIVEREPNNSLATAQKVKLPIIINGRINRPGDWDVFQFNGKSNETIVAEVQARRLDSPLDSVMKLTDAQGRILAFNDDHEDLLAGVNTHQADSYFMIQLPSNGAYFVHLGDTAGQGGPEYGYRLRLSEPQPDFELRVVPSSLSLRTNSTAALTIYAARKDGFAGPIRVILKNPPAGFSAFPLTLAATQTVAQFRLKGPSAPTREPVSLSIEGQANSGAKELAHDAVPAEDRMQAFLWHHLVPANDLRVLVFDPNYQPPTRPLASLPSPPDAPKKNAVVAVPAGATTTAIALTNAARSTNVLSAATAKPKFTPQQIAARLQQLKLLYNEGLLTRDFYSEKVAECEPAP